MQPPSMTNIRDNRNEFHQYKFQQISNTERKSKRMGTDKAKLKYYAKEHSLYLMDLLHSKNIEVYLSTNSDKQSKRSIWLRLAVIALAAGSLFGLSSCYHHYGGHHGGHGGGHGSHYGGGYGGGGGYCHY